jgi:RNA polymerase sigma-70 factor (ECF subfamily)
MGDSAGAPNGGRLDLSDSRRPEPFLALVEGGLGPAYRLARAILLDDQEAEDAVQDACLAAWRRRGSLREPARFGAWFDRIVINACRDHLRRRRRERRRVTALEVAWMDPIGAPTPDGAKLDAALDALDLEHRLVVLLRYWRDLPLDGIAERLDIPLGTVKSRLHYALRAMRAQLEVSDGRP